MHYLSPADVADMVPGLSVGALAQLRFTGKGPRFMKPTPRTVVYEKEEVEDWLKSSTRLNTRA